jgi:hypothetical protein
LLRQELEIDVFGEDVSHFSLPPVAQRWFYDPAVLGADPKTSRACALSFCCSVFKRGAEWELPQHFLYTLTQ